MKTHSSSKALTAWAHGLKAGCEQIHVPGLPNSLLPSSSKPSKFIWKADIFEQLVSYKKKWILRPE